MFMAVSTSKHLHQYHLLSSAIRKFPPSSTTSLRFFYFPNLNFTLKSKSCNIFQDNALITPLDTQQEPSENSRKCKGVSDFGDKDIRVDKEVLENNVKGIGGIKRGSQKGDTIFKRGEKIEENVHKMGANQRVNKKREKTFNEVESSKVKYVGIVPEIKGIEKGSKKMGRSFEGGESSQMNYARNVVKRGGIERVGEKMGSSSSKVKSMGNMPKLEGVERVSKRMDNVSKKGESSELNFAENVPKMEGVGRITKKLDDVSKRGENGGQAGVRMEKREKASKKFKKDSPENMLKMGLDSCSKREKASKKFKKDSPENMLKMGLDSCSKRGDVMGGIKLYDLAKREGIVIQQYHYAVLLYLCSSAASGTIQPAKSGSGARTLSMVDSSHEADLDLTEKMDKRPSENVSGNFEKKEKDLNQFLNEYSELEYQTFDGLARLLTSDDKQANDKEESYSIKVTEDMKNYAFKRGSEIYEEMVSRKVPMNEASLTSLARMAMSMGNGDMAFDMVKKMKELGINPRLRSYGPALSVFCNNGDIEKAFAVEEHMLEHGVNPEAPELEALMRASVEASKSDKVYYLLHKLRKNVRKVSPSTAGLIEKWFSSSTATRVGKRKWDPNVILKAIEDGGGGWHGQGWLGKGKWKVVSTNVGEDGFCKGCGQKLVTIDLDPAETENFAESVARIAKERDKNSSFQKFQKWLDYHGPFEAVVDAANVGLFNSKAFSPSKVDLVVEEIRKMLPSKKWPLIVLHNRRITGDNMDKGVNRTLIAKWKVANAVYATPTGSNDDWYWLYAAIKFKSLLVTNDEMRDHLFQLLGNDFFPRWKERHQVRLTRYYPNLEFQMPPPCSVVIQESEIGHWHIPVVSEKDTEVERTWLCITRCQTNKTKRDSNSSN